jgi:hypothetical protein
MDAVWGARRLRRVRHEDDGQIIVLVAVSMFAFLMFLALALNIGMWYDSDAGLQKAADLSALAGAQYIENGSTLASSNASYPCGPAAGVTDAIGCATLVAGLNGIVSPETANAQLVNQNGVQGIKVTTRHPNESGLFFKSTRTESATAIVGGIAGAPNTFPATFPSGSWVAGQHIRWPFGSAPQPGAFNMLATCIQPGTSSLENCFRCAQTYSYDAATGTLTPIPNTDPNCTGVTYCSGSNQLPSSPGNTISNPNVVAAINTLSGKIVLVPVYTGTQGTGSNATYTLGGFAAILLDNPAAVTVGTGVNKTVQLSGTFEKAVGPTGAGTCGGGSGNYGVTSVYLIG